MTPKTEEPDERLAAQAARSPFDEAQLASLSMPLDRDRVRSRKGRGGGQFSYLTTHDCIRAANAIFGFGNWGTEVVEQERIAEAPVKDGNKEGIHVAYRCVVRVTVKDCIPVTGTGYGDAVEYLKPGSNPRATASELALKESESDALKRALVKFGDQFGLELYAKEDEISFVRQQQQQEEASGPARPDGGSIQTWPQILDAFVAWAPSFDWPAIFQAAAADFYREGATINELPKESKIDAGRRCIAALFWLWENTKGPDFVPPVSSDDVLQAFAVAFDGLALPSQVVQPRESAAAAAPVAQERPEGAPEGDPASETETANDGE